MIRCNNCGWFNLNTATHCEKCGEPLDSSQIEEPQEEPKEEKGMPVVADAPSPAHPMAETEPRLITKTIPLGEEEPVPQSQKNYGATVLDAGEVIQKLEEEQVSVCPKCRYPLVAQSEFCPNCGTTLRRNTRKEVSSAVKESVDTASKKMMATIRDGDAGTASAKSASKGRIGKATIRDIPAELLEEAPAKSAPEKTSDVFRLVPVSGEDYPVVYMSIGDLITINGLRFRFEK